MTELELQQYLLSNYPKENEECEWKEFKSMKCAKTYETSSCICT